MPILSKLHSSRASLRSDLCDAGPLLRRSTSGVQCSFLIEHDHGFPGSLVHGRKPLSSSRMPGNHIHGNGLPATFVPGRRNVCEGCWAVDESLKKSLASLFHCFLNGKKYFTNPSCLPHWQRKTSPRSTALVTAESVCIPFLHTLVSRTGPVLRNRRRS